MDFSSRQLLGEKAKRMAVYLVALFLMLYVMADVSVLQAIHGSEIAGIPPAHHATENPRETPEELSLAPNNEHGAGLSNSDSRNNSNEDCSDADNCLASCSHIIVSYFVFANHSGAEIKQLQDTFFRENMTPKSEPSDVFHPPETA
jgi:hypothetical protein